MNFIYYPEMNSSASQNSLSSVDREKRSGVQLPTHSVSNSNLYFHEKEI